MWFVFNAVAPIFALIAVGAVTGHWRLLSPETGKALSEFVFRLAIPALLLRTMVRADLTGTDVPGLWGAQFGAIAVGWSAATLISRYVLHRSPPESVVLGMTTAHGNLLLLGLPVALSAFGPPATPIVAVLLSLHSPVLWLAAMLNMAIARRADDTDVLSLLKGLVLDLGRNPIIMAIALGTLLRITGLGLHPVLDRLLDLLGASSVPCALVALGMSLTRFQIAGEQATVALLLVLKLAVMPLVAWILATIMLGLAPMQAGVVVLFAAMPTGANAYLFADRYGYGVGSTSAAIAVGTILSFPLLTALVYAFSPR